MSDGGKLSTDGGQSLGSNPFAGLSGAGLPAAAGRLGATAPTSPPAKKNRGRVDILRETAGRGGNGVTTVFDLPLDESGLRELAGTLK